MSNIKKIDLHVHSKYSEASDNAIISSFKSAESYIDPVEVYNTAKKHGMDYVTITDHNTIKGCVELKKLYPDEVILGVEATAHFPEDNCPVHILLYGFTEKQFCMIEKLRKNIYDLRHYIKKENIAYSVAHPTYRITKALKLEHVEKLMLLFDVFEGINGCNNERFNESVIDVFSSLTPEKMAELKEKHNIDTFSDTPWEKSFTGGSDDHVGIFNGKTHTEAEANSIEEFVQAIKDQRTTAAGGSRDYKRYAFHLYKGFNDFISHKKNKKEKGLFTQITEYVLADKPLSFKNFLKLQWMKRKAKKVYAYKKVHELMKISKNTKIDFEERLDLVYETLTDLSDHLIKGFFERIDGVRQKGEFPALVKNLPHLVAGALIYGPFIFAAKYMYKDYSLMYEVEDAFLPEKKNKRKKVLWFTDTINDLNGVSVTLRSIGWRSYHRGESLKLVSSIAPDEELKDLPPNYVNLEPIYRCKVPYYEKLEVKVPSLFKMIEQLADYRPDKVYISSPVTIGLFGLLYAKLFKCKCVAVYHTDFTMQAKDIIGEKSFMINIIEKYTKWFHEQADKILLPTKEYIDILVDRGFKREQLGVFHRGIDSSHFMPKEVEGREYLKVKCGLQPGVNLVYAGRISEDKNIDFLIESYNKLLKKHPKTNLIFAGDGPYLEALKEMHNDKERVHFLGEVPNTMLPLVYSGSDILVFPSITDTFGMVVLEAQSCGLPALVSNVGGPKGIVQDGTTGFVLETKNTDNWYFKLDEMITWVESMDARYIEMKNKAREHVVSNYDVNRVLDNYFYTSE